MRKMYINWRKNSQRPQQAREKRQEKTVTLAGKYLLYRVHTKQNTKNYKSVDYKIWNMYYY